MAHALKLLGWAVDLIYYNSTPFVPCEEFSCIWNVRSASEAYGVAKIISPQLIHVFSGAIDDYVLLFCRNKVAPVVIDLNDVFTPSLMDYCSERYEPTKEALALADGFCARDLQSKIAERYDNCKLPKHILFYPEYCWNLSSSWPQTKIGNEIHVVSVGTISLESNKMYDCCYLELVKQIIKQGVHFHIYPPWCYRKDFQTVNIDFDRDYVDFIALARNSPYLHIHNSLPVEQLAEELQRYDFGIISGGCKEFGQKYTHYKPKYVESCYSGRISDYLDANLPVLINQEVAFDYWLLSRYGVAVDLKGVLKPNFKEKLQMFKRDFIKKNTIEEVKNRLSIASNAKRLVDFYVDIIQSTPQPDKGGVSARFDVFNKIKKYFVK